MHMNLSRLLLVPSILLIGFFATALHAHPLKPGHGLQRAQICAAVADPAKATSNGTAISPERQAVRSLLAQECELVAAGQRDKVENMYRGVLASATAPALRRVAYRRLTRMAMRQGNRDAAKAWRAQARAERCKADSA